MRYTVIRQIKANFYIIRVCGKKKGEKNKFRGCHI